MLQKKSVDALHAQQRIRIRACACVVPMQLASAHDVDVGWYGMHGSTVFDPQPACMIFEHASGALTGLPQTRTLVNFEWIAVFFMCP